MKRILLIIFLTLLIFQIIVLAIAIDIGYIDSAYSNNNTETYTWINQINPANASGKITLVSIYVLNGYGDITSVEVATFYIVSGTNFTTRDSQNIGTLTQNGQRTATVDLDVEAGDYIGIKFLGGRIGNDPTTGYTCWYRSDDNIPCTNATFTVSANNSAAVYGTGATIEGGNAIMFGINF
jgi:hypothetical protein